jgi:4-hydroxy-2-oxoheptanedioate aldolase
MIPRIEIVEMIAAAGFDAVLVDLEHGPITTAELGPLVTAGQGRGLYVIARIAPGAEIGPILDLGVDGVLAPHVTSASDAAALVRAGRFPPQGDRSLNPYVRGTAYGTSDAAGPHEANDRTALIAMLEGAQALVELDAICAVNDIDAVFIGPVDLSGALGLVGQPEHPKVIEAIRDTFRRLERHDIGTGIYAPSPQAAARWLAAGATLVAISADVAMGMHAFRDTRHRLSLAVSAELGSSERVATPPDEG